jgi:hypothetical protein
VRQTTEAKEIPKTILNTRLKTKKKHGYFGFRKIPCGFLPKSLNYGIFSVFGGFIEEPDVLGKSTNILGLNAPKLRIVDFFSKDYNLISICGVVIINDNTSRQLFF